MRDLRHTGAGFTKAGSTARLLRAKALPHVLVVDDEPGILGLVAQILQAEQLVVSTAGNGSQALELARREPDFCLAIVDWRMPQMGGEQLLDQLVGICPETKAIVISGDNPEDVERAFSGCKVDAFIRKPFRSETLRTAVKSVLAA